jgi:hypothetical protein
MTERGGPTTQAGIDFQNSITALKLGRLLDSTSRPDSEMIVAVRAEAPTHVDDTVVTYSDGHRDFIQAKLAITAEPWSKLWRDVSAEFAESTFLRGRDRLVLSFGEQTTRVEDLRESAERARGAADVAEWRRRLTHGQRDLVDDIAGRIGFTAESNELLQLFGHIVVETLTPTMIERDLIPLWMPSTSHPQTIVFRLLRDRVARHASTRREFTRDHLLASLENEDSSFSLSRITEVEIADAVTACGAVLEHHKASFGSTNGHLSRTIVGDIAAWLQSAESAGTIALVLDDAGAGKSVVMRDVANTLRQARGSVLAIKADLQLTGVTSAEEIQARLQLPESLERVAARLAADGGVVIVIDQLDALSLSMAQDRRTLEVVMDAVVRLVRIPGIRVIASCRTFDRNNDPRLRQLETKKEFRVGLLTDEELSQALTGAGLGPIQLSQTTRTLLRVPLHFDLFLLAHGDTQPATLQDLYSAVLDHRALRRGDDIPPATIRAQALKALTTAMFTRQQTVVPATFFLDEGGDDMQAAAEWLASEGILLRSTSGWAFRHQTLFDYLFAREFVESGRSLVDYLRDGPQGLSSRSALVHILGYQRAADPQRYITQVDAIWRGEGIRFHLRHLLMRWFGTLPNPTAAETAWVRRLLRDANDHQRFLNAASC